MKRSLVVLFIVVMVALYASAFLLIQPQNDSTNKGNEKEPSKVLSLLTVVNNDVQVKSLEEESFKVIDKSTEVEVGDKVKTSPNGRAIIEGSEQTVIVDKNSEIIIENNNDKSTKIQLEIGALWMRITKVFGGEEEYQVRTSNAVATVRGTSFGVFYSNSSTVILVSEGVVSVSSLNTKTKEKTGDEFIAQKNQKATIYDNKEPVIESLTEKDKKLEFFQFNNTSDSSAGSGIGSQKPVPPTITNPPTSPPKTVCAQDAKQCPDGSYVSRVAPNCEFAECPKVIAQPDPELLLIDPNSIDISNNRPPNNIYFAIRGNNLNGVMQVLLDNIPIEFKILDSYSMECKIPEQIQAKMYDVSVISKQGKKLTISRAINLFIGNNVGGKP